MQQIEELTHFKKWALLHIRTPLWRQYEPVPRKPRRSNPDILPRLSASEIEKCKAKDVMNEGNKAALKKDINDGKIKINTNVVTTATKQEPRIGDDQ